MNPLKNLAKVAAISLPIAGLSSSLSEADACITCRPHVVRSVERRVVRSIDYAPGVVIRSRSKVVVRNAHPFFVPTPVYVPVPVAPLAPVYAPPMHHGFGRHLLYDTPHSFHLNIDIGGH